MKHDMIWGYLIHLCQTMWSMGDPESCSNYGRTESETDKSCQQLTVQWDKFFETMDFLPSQGINTLVFDLGNAVRFERHPELAMKGSLSKDEMKKLIDRCRALGMEPIPKLNFSAGHDPWLRKYSMAVGTEEYYSVCLDCIDETAELFGYPSLFHLGLDEENPGNQGGYGVQITRAPHIWWRDANRLFDRCEHHNIRPWVWSDIYWDFPEDFKKNMPKSVLQAPWYYAPPRDFDKNGIPANAGFRTYFELARMGYDIVPTCSTWHNETNTDYTFRLVRDMLPREHTLGVMTAPWDYCVDENNYLCLQDAVRFGTAKKKYFPED